MANPNDNLRHEILKCLYEIHVEHTGTHRHETQGDRLSSEVRKRTGFDKPAISSNINYLVDQGFIHHRREPQYLRDGRQIEGKHLYRIAGSGIDHIEGGSQFVAQGRASSVTVINQDGVVTVGSGNVINIEQQQKLHAILNEIRKVIEASGDIHDTARRDALGDLETVRAQLAKAQPNEGIIKTAWKGIEMAVTSVGAAELLKQAALLLFP